ncbi:LytR/AlgR family response regulator transcription factor [Cytophaga aurantiaca]|uniref:LytR/AlgR family response regulator transcription factor n=1 Tax=Cytophaga aurantiaca TaxID=29530 RepID=UPI00035FF0A2|nr:LytTR family transcriptional regulator DNA-binding domain-containing protein [Cytophaga aurantiaca]
MNTIRTIIIDDEPLARDLIRLYLKDYTSFQIIEECANGFEGLKAIQELKPDVIFLDIEMPKVTGLEMLELLDQPPVVIFTTAYQEHAIKAFDLNALDYLLKPFSKDRFKKAIDKIVTRIESKTVDPNIIKDFIKEPPLPHGTIDRIVVKTINSIKIIPASEIKYLEAQDDYVMIYTHEGKFLKQQTMKYFEHALDPAFFIRIHRSYLINVREILRIEPYEKSSYQVILKDNTTLPISRTGYSLLKEKLNF